MTKVSVVIPAYRAETFIGNAVRSALAQSLRDLEVIVVDDGSDDGTAQAATASADGDARLKVIRLSQNAGVSAARNAGLRVARGEWIAVLDADDRFSGDRLARLVRAADTLDADLLADHVLLDTGGQACTPIFSVPRRLMGAPMSARQFIELDSPTCPLGFMKPLVRRAFLEQHTIHYPLGIHAGEDFHLYVLCLLKGAKLYWSSDTSYVATARAGSLSRSDGPRAFAMFETSVRLLTAEANRAGNREASRALARRSREIRSYSAYTDLSAALHERRFVKAATTFAHLSLEPYTWRRFATAAKRRLSVGTEGA